MSRTNLLVRSVRICLWILLLKVVTASQACHPDTPPTLEIAYAWNSSKVSVTRGSCYFDVAFYYNDAFLVRPKSGVAWFEPWVRDVWAYMRRNFGSCAVPRTPTSGVGRQCENFAAPKAVAVYAMLGDNAMTRQTISRFITQDGANRDHIHIYKDSFEKADAAVIKDGVGQELALIAEMTAQGIHNWATPWLWSKSWGWSPFLLYDFYHQSGAIASRDRYYATKAAHFIGRGYPDDATGHSWFLFFHELWLNNGQNVYFMTKFWHIFSRYYPLEQISATKEWHTTKVMNIGEFAHFISAAVGRNLTSMMEPHFNTGWKPQTYFDALAEFPFLTYDS
ncbi:hypothetical protein DFS34DRAFT_629601 [Phlyctochytrium arcticum]|nr:hypothetical protein DFS34DRAFT_629601 [Phlyctochytrium arcticum]